MVTFGGIAPPRSSLGWLLGLYSMARASDARRAALRRDAGDKRTPPRRNVRRGADKPDAVVRGSAGLRAQRQLDVVALLVLAKGLRVALELVDRAVLVADGHHAVLLVHADDRAVDLLGRVALGRRRAASRCRSLRAPGRASISRAWV